MAGGAAARRLRPIEARRAETPEELTRCATVSPAQAGTSVLTQRMRELVPTFQKDFAQLKKTYGDAELEKITVGHALGGMRDIMGLLCETSLLDANEVCVRATSTPYGCEWLSCAPRCMRVPCLCTSAHF